MTIEYKIVTSPRLDRMEDMVSMALNEGWQLEDMFIATSGAMAQTMTREVKGESTPKPAKLETKGPAKAGTKTKKLGDGS